MTNVEALKALYIALGGKSADVANASTIVEVLNATSALFEGDNDAVLNAEAIANIAAVADNIKPETTLIEKTITENGTYNAEDDSADGYSSVNVEVSGGGFSYVVATSGTGSSSEVTGFFTSASGDYYFEGGYEYASGDYIIFANGTIILCDPLKTFEHLSGFDTGRIVFTPASDYVGFFYNEASGEAPTITGDTITAGDGNRYTLTISRDGNTKSFVVTKSSSAFKYSKGG